MPLLESRRRADLALVMVTLLWGMTFPLIRGAVAEIDPFVFVALRFGLAALVFAPLVLMGRGAAARVRRSLLAGFAVGAVAWTSYLCQTIGLQTVEAGRAGVITGTSVILVPLMSPLFGAGRPGAVTLVSAALATAGIWLLCDPAATGFGVGDCWVMGCAVGYAIYIHALQIALKRGNDPTALAFTQVLAIAACGLVAWPLGAAEGASIPATTAVLVALVFCSLFATVGCFFLQTRYQGRTTPERAALIFSLEPVFAAGFAWLLLGETFTLTAAVGAAIILVAVVGSEVLSARLGRDDDPAGDEASTQATLPIEEAVT